MKYRLFKRLSYWLSRRSDKSAFEESHHQELQYGPVWISDALVRQTLVHLRSFYGAEIMHEGLVYWAGVPMKRGGIVTTLIVPNASSGPGFVETTPEENAEIILELNRAGVALLGQAHSHPTGSSVRHSAGDDARTFSPFEGSLSIVIPDYATGTTEQHLIWGIHRFVNGAYQWIDPSDHSRHLRIVDAEIIRR